MVRLSRFCAVMILGALLVTAVPALLRAAPPARRRLPPATQPIVPAPASQPGPARIPLRQPNSFPNSPAFSTFPTFRSFQPFSLPSWVNPAFQVAPGLTVGQAAFNTAVLGQGLSFVPPYALGFNPYTSGAISSPYGGYGGYYPPPYYGTGYGGGGYGGSGSQSVMNAGFGGGQPAYNTTSTPTTAPGYGGNADQKIPAAGKAGVLAVLLGDGGGQLDWPQAVRILPPAPEATKLRDAIDGLALQAVADAEANGKADPTVVKRLRQQVRALRELYADRKDLLPVSETIAQAGTAYLRQLEAAIKDME